VIGIWRRVGGDDGSGYRSPHRRYEVLTIRGRTGFVVAMLPICREAADAVAKAIGEHLTAEARDQAPSSAT
jgi:hypothetical protein